MRIRSLATALILVLASAAAAPAANPIPGIPIIIRCPCCPCPNGYVESSRCCHTKKVTASVGFFGPGSVAFNEDIRLQGRCGQACGGCEDGCDGDGDDGDGRIDYAADSDAGPFTMTMSAMALRSHEPIAVDMGGGVTSFFDVFVTVSGAAPGADDPILGSLSLPPGQSLPVGATQPVAASSLDLHVTTTFADALTGAPVGVPLEQDLHLELFGATPTSVSRVADGTPEGRIVLGLEGSSPDVFGYANPGDDLVMVLRSLYAGAPVADAGVSWGAVKAGFR